jgi:hypothetical protein
MATLFIFWEDSHFPMKLCSENTYANSSIQWPYSNIQVFKKISYTLVSFFSLVNI